MSSENTFQLELVDPDGHRILQRPVDVDELLRQHGHTLSVGNGVAVHLEEYQEDQEHENDADESEYTHDDDEETEEGDAEGSAELEEQERFLLQHAPPGTRSTGGWYDVLNELRQEQRQRESSGSMVESGYSALASAERGATQEKGRLGRRSATPLKAFSRAASAQPKSKEPVTAVDARARAPSEMKSRRDVWSSFAPPADPETDFKRLEFVSVMDGAGCGSTGAVSRHFRPSALSFHAMTSYLCAKDDGQRVLVYGGVSTASLCVQKELFEFSVLTGNWRRLEGKQFVPAGHMGHTMTVVESIDKLVVIGGVGPCGAGDRSGKSSRRQPGAFADDPLRSLREALFFPRELRQGTRTAVRSASPFGVGGGPDALVAVGARARGPAVDMDFVPFLFDMDLADQRWRAIQPAQPFPLAFHTAVSFNGEIFIFGGLTEELIVSGQLIAVDVTTYALRLVQPNAARRGEHGTAQNSDGEAETDDDAEAEAVGPGPRFLHSAVRYGNYMVVHGGYDAHNECQSDTWAFDMVNERWERLPCGGESPARAGHTASVVGSRMMVFGGFACSLEEATNSGEGEEVGGPEIEHVIVELNLVPNVRGEHVWRNDIKTRRPLPPLVFAGSASCGDDCSVVLFGGLTKGVRPSKDQRGGDRKVGKKSRSASPRMAVKRGQEGDHADTTTPGFVTSLITLDDAIVMTFPLKQRRSRSAGDGAAPRVNALGVEVDPTEMPESFKTFVRRQEDFLKKKDNAAATTQRKTTLEEREAMEPTLYLTEDEIQRVVDKSEELCETFLSYKMDTLPGNVPDRERRIHIIEECVSLSRQVRDVVRSMKGSRVAVTAVKSKSHRRRAGQKFEDFSAAKPFRRVVIMNLVGEINKELETMHRLNKALRTVDWEEKEGFKEAIDGMQNTVHSFTRTAEGIVGKYISSRVEKLMKGVQRHEEVMRLLTEVVARNVDDKIWGRDEARDAQRAKVQANWDKTEREASQRDREGGAAKRSASGAFGSRRGVAMRSHSTGGGYHADEEKANITIPDKEWESLIRRATRLEQCAQRLQNHCLEGMKSSVLEAAGAAGVAQPAVKAGSPVAETPPVPPAAAAVPPKVHSSSSSDTSRSDTPPAPVAVPPPVVSPPPPAADQPSSPALEAGTASPKEILIRRSNSHRERIIAVSKEVTEVAEAFTLALQSVEEAAAPIPPTSFPPSPVTDGVAADPPAAELGVPVALNVSQPVPVVVQAPTQPITRPKSPSSSSSSSSSSGSSSSSSSRVRVAAAPPPLQIAPPPVAPAVPPPVVELETAAAAPPAAPVQTAQPVGHPSVPAAVEKPNAKSKAKAAASPTAPPPPGQHRVFLRHLRPLLRLRDALGAAFETVSLIRINEWDDSDLAGAPQDTKAVKLYERVKASLVALIQSVTAGFLSAAGAKKPRKLPTKPQAMVAVPKRAPSKARSSAKPKPSATSDGQAGAGVQVPSDGVVDATAAVSVQGALEVPNGGTTTPPAAGTTALLHSVRLGALQGGAHTRCSEMPKLPRPEGGETPAVSERARPLVSYDALLLGSTAQQGAKSSSSASLGGQTAASLDAGSRIVVEVASIAPNQIVEKSTLAASSAVATSAQQQTVRPVVSVAPGPVVRIASKPTDGDGAAERTSGCGAKLSDAFTTLQVGAVTSTTRPSSGLAEQPATSILPGPFTVNPEYFYRTYAADAQLTSGQDSAIPGTSHVSWAEADEDYFYFGKATRETQRSAVALSPPAVVQSGDVGSRHAVSGPPAPVTVSPPVGSALGSQRATVSLVSRTSASGTASARRQVPLAEMTNRPTSQRTAREESKKRLTPGELQILQGRERLRCKKH